MIGNQARWPHIDSLGERKSQMRILVCALSIGVASLLSSGCGMYMAFTQPPKVDTPALEAGGLPRDLVIERLGAPKSSIKNVNGGYRKSTRLNSSHIPLSRMPTPA